MKRIFLSLSMVALLAAGAYAQGLSGGIKAGLNLANVNGDDAGDTDMRVAYHAGLFLNAGLSDAFSVQPELLLNSVGAKLSEDGIDYTYKLNYLSVPIMAIYSFGPINIQAGPQFGFLMGAKVKAEAGGQSEEVDAKDFFKSTDLAVNLGVGAKFSKLHASARYSIGFTEIWDAEEDIDVKNGVIQVSLGYALFGGN